MVNCTTCVKCVTEAKITAFGSRGVSYQRTVMLVCLFQAVQLGVSPAPWLIEIAVLANKKQLRSATLKNWAFFSYLKLHRNP